MNPPSKYSKENIVHCNLRTNYHSKLVKLSKDLSEEQREKYIKLMKAYSNVFAWKHEYLKTYDKEIIQHKIPLKPNTNPFKKKLKHLNPILLPIIEK